MDIPDLNLGVNTTSFIPDLNLDIHPNLDVDTGLSEQAVGHATPRLLDLNVEVEIMEKNVSFDLNMEPYEECEEIQCQVLGELFQNSHENIHEEFTNTVVSGPSNNTKNWKVLSNEQRRAMFEMLLKKSSDGKLKSGVTKMVALQFGVSMRTVQRIWKQSKHDNCVSHKRTRNCGRKRIHLDLNIIRDIPLQKCTTLRSLACSLNTNTTTLFRRLKSGEVRRHSNAIKPYLKEENKLSRLKFCISMLESASIPQDPTFSGMYNIVHIDEKWFYMTKKSERYYLLPDEEDPLRTCKSKNFIGKVMFLVAIARPRFDAQGKEIFSGKIGVFPFITHEEAKRSSINRVAGTLETKPITSVKKDVIKTYLIEKVIPAIKKKWPKEDARHPIFIQQDNARKHIDANDHQFIEAANRDGFDIRLMCQPPNSPDLNVLDLGFFSAIQSLQYKKSPKNVDELIDAVVQAYEEFPTNKSNYIFLTLQVCMIEIMKVKGSQNYKIPHVKKAVLEKRCELPTQFKCDPQLVQEVLDYLDNDHYVNIS